MLKRARLYNVCQFEDITIESGPGVTIVVGPQGAGKTNLLSMTVSSLTGENPLPGNKKLNIREGAEKEQAFVSTEWEFGDSTYQITRGLNKVSSNLAVNGQTKSEIRRETEITDYMMSKLGLDKKDVWRYSFVSQSATDAILTTLPTDRVRFLANLLDVPEILEWYAEVDEAVKTVGNSLGFDYRTSLREQLVDRNRFAVERRELSEELRQYQAAEVSVREEYEVVAPAFEAAIRLDEVNKRIDTARQEIANLQVQLKQHEVNLQKMNEEHQKRVDLHAEFIRLAKLESDRLARQAYEREIDATEKTIASLEKALAEKPEKPEWPDDLEDRYAEVSQQYSQVTRDLNLVIAGKDTCQTCGQSIDVSQSRRQELQSLQQELITTGRQLKAIKDNVQAYMIASGTYDSLLPERQASLQAAKEKFDNLGMQLMLLPISFEIPQWFYSAGPGAADQYACDVQASKNQIAKLENQLQFDLQSLQKLQAGLASMEQEAGLLAEQAGDVNREKIDQLWKALQRGGEVISQLKEKLTEVTMKCEHNRKSLAELVKGYRSQRKSYISKSYLDELASHMRPKELPRDILYEMLSGLGARMSKLCADLNQPFRVTIADDLDFCVTHLSGRVESAQRLSGGQRACVSTVFWLVRLLANIGNKLPVLVLDEPSANMDPNGVVGQFGEMLMRLNPLLVEAGVQVFVITHHHQLRGCGSYVVDLGELCPK